MTELMAVINGKPVPLQDATWISFTKCGCPFGALTAAFGDEAFATEEQVLREIYPLKRDRDRFYARGSRLELMAWDRYRAEIDLSVRCPHAKTTPPAPGCETCGGPIPAGRKAFCKPACSLADKDHGSDDEPEGDDQ